MDTAHHPAGWYLTMWWKEWAGMMGELVLYSPRGWCSKRLVSPSFIVWDKMLYTHCVYMCVLVVAVVGVVAIACCRGGWCWRWRWWLLGHMVCELATSAVLYIAVLGLQGGGGADPKHHNIVVIRVHHHYHGHYHSDGHYTIEFKVSSYWVHYVVKCVCWIDIVLMVIIIIGVCSLFLVLFLSFFFSFALGKEMIFFLLLFSSLTY